MKIQNLLSVLVLAVAIACLVSCPSVLSQASTLQAKALTASDLSHGHIQLKKMLHDRPVMKEWLELNSSFPSKWAVRQFAGAGGVGRIYWDSNQLDEAGNEYYASSKYPSRGKFGSIRLRSINHVTGKPYDAETLWHGFVFETFNIQNAKEFQRIDNEAEHGRLSKEQFIEKTTRVEFAALQRTAKFYGTVIYPAAYKNNIETKPKIWGSWSPKTYEAWIAQYTDHHHYPFDSFGKIYDRQYSSGKTKGKSGKD